MQLATRWLFARKRTVTQSIVYSGALELKHFCSFHRFFSAAAGSLDAVGIAVFSLLAARLTPSACSGNAAGFGGGISNFGPVTATIKSSLISGNTASVGKEILDNERTVNLKVYHPIGKNSENMGRARCAARRPRAATIWSGRLTY